MGKLDIYLCHAGPAEPPRPTNALWINQGVVGTRNLRHMRDPYGGAKLYHNDGRRFTDVSVAAGIHSPEMAFGLGLAVGDVNREGWPDIYVGNDFFERDHLYISDTDGTFSEALDRQAPVLTYFSMEVDVADVDNDQWPDIYTADMLPEDEYRLKTTAVFEAWDVYQPRCRTVITTS